MRLRAQLRVSGIAGDSAASLGPLAKPTGPGDPEMGTAGKFASMVSGANFSSRRTGSRNLSASLQKGGSSIYRIGMNAWAGAGTPVIECQISQTHYKSCFSW